MRVLVACEYSGTVRDAFIRKGHSAWSCDILPTDVEGPHYQCDVREIIDNDWDLMIAHPPCTYLSVSGMHWTTRGYRDRKLTEDALDFVQFLLNAPIPKIALENPVSVISTAIRKPDQAVHPWMFGHNESKTTCFWLKNLPTLTHGKIIAPRGFELVKDSLLDTRYAVTRHGYTFAAEEKMTLRWGNQTPAGHDRTGPMNGQRWKHRSKTFEGIANAMAEQWG